MPKDIRSFIRSYLAATEWNTPATICSFSCAGDRLVAKMGCYVTHPSNPSLILKSRRSVPQLGRRSGGEGRLDG
jgi:hypothetical protein